MAIPAKAFQYFSYNDQIMVQQWINKVGFEIYSANPHQIQQSDRWQYTQDTLQALHMSRPEQFYRYLSELLILAGSTGDDALNQLLQPVLNLNKKQRNVFDTFILEQNKSDLSVWLSHYMELEKRLANDDKLYSQLFELLTRTVISNTQQCPEMLMLESFKGVKEKRHAVLQCIALSVKLYIVDIDISHNRIATAKILGPAPVSTDLTSLPATVLDNSEYPFSTIPELYDNPQTNPVILFTSPLEKGFLVSHRKRIQKTNRPPVSPLTESDIEKLRQRFKSRKGNQSKHQKSRHFLSYGKHDPVWPDEWIKSPGYTIAGSLALSVIITLVFTMVPYPGNPWLGS
ncbi:hypothetical protein [Endozoicomonas sp. SCSIO W0465]|uniref:hypothetical protein n=1 Tax=Endozoicomonas sp. SCSIO W0465 TaxID=2918516 RepID=UPI002075EF89|nr:hypothetical protein [Endozoicomonas sp. SCSIO W0465]USE35355.1 hypothetical protein MJO57_25155 [Endozoicomonas sp. SCSIO W0465]